MATALHLGTTQIPAVRFLPCTVGQVGLQPYFRNRQFWSRTPDLNGDLPAPKAGDLPISPMRVLTFKNYLYSGGASR